MDEERIERALRAGPADEPRYSPLGRGAPVRHRAREPVRIPDCVRAAGDGRRCRGDRRVDRRPADGRPGCRATGGPRGDPGIGHDAGRRDLGQSAGVRDGYRVSTGSTSTSRERSASASVSRSRSARSTRRRSRPADGAMPGTSPSTRRCPRPGGRPAWTSASATTPGQGRSSCPMVRRSRGCGPRGSDGLHGRRRPRAAMDRRKPRSRRRRRSRSADRCPAGRTPLRGRMHRSRGRGDGGCVRRRLDDGCRAARGRAHRPRGGPVRGCRERRGRPRAVRAAPSCCAEIDRIVAAMHSDGTLR